MCSKTKEQTTCSKTRQTARFFGNNGENKKATIVRKQKQGKKLGSETMVKNNFVLKTKMVLLERYKHYELTYGLPHVRVVHIAIA